MQENIVEEQIEEDFTKRTPMMEQWYKCKQTAKEAVLLFRMGDFYEAFYEDAHILAQELDLTLTKRQEIPMSGVPHHTCDGYVDRLVGKGYRVAIAEQMEDPAQAKGLVKREVVRILTPGTLINSALIAEKKHNFIVAIHRTGAFFGLASLDITTANFQVVELDSETELLSELYRLQPAEILTSKKFKEKNPDLFKEMEGVLVSVLDEWQFDHKTTYAYLTEHFQTGHLDHFGLKGQVSAINAAGALLAYIREELSLPTQHIREIRPYAMQDYLVMDRVAQKNLELTESMQDHSKKNSLLYIIDQTDTPMGGRLLRLWLKKPLLDVEKICQRQLAVEALIFSPQIRPQLKQQLGSVRDLERLMMKISTGFATPRDLLALRFSLERVEPIKQLVCQVHSKLLVDASSNLYDMSSLIETLTNALVDEPPLRLSDAPVFREGFHPPLDELRSMTRGGKEWLVRYQNQIKEETGIKNLKVSFNKIFGYYIEVSKGQAHLMPATFQKRQTLVNAERFVSPTLMKYEQKVLAAEDQIRILENQLFQDLRLEVARYEERIFTLATAIAQIDVLTALAEVAKKGNFCRPTVDLSDRLQIIGGRHPVIEAAQFGTFIPNDTELNTAERLMLITGPNMAGKSTYMRQVALIVILAQIGSFVPASQATIGVIDKIFTRIGASDDLSRGQSTFMVEMGETAHILNNATARSLILLDELGRGTATYDGVSIAWAVAEYLLTKEGKVAKTLFATHYWELTQLEKTIKGAVNYHASVLEKEDGIVFSHKIVRGGTGRSYGIQVAKLAGLPLSVISRAQSILKRLEGKKEQLHNKKESNETQLTLF